MANAHKLNPPFRADHVGSLKRPEHLQRARERLLGEHDAEHNLSGHDNAELRALEDRCIEEAIALQESIGLQSITDGDFRRRTWWTDFVLGFDGIDVSMAGKSKLQFHNEDGSVRPMPTIEVTDKIRWCGSTMVEAFKFLKARTSRTPKVMMPAPPIIHYFAGREFIDRDVYPDLDAFWADIAAAYRAELEALAASGCSYVQMDECMIAFLCDPKHRHWLSARGDDPDALLGDYIAAINAAITGRPDGLTIGLHLCRGNMSGHWLAEGGYEPVADALFNTTNVDAFFLEYDTPRAGDFKPLRFVPEGKTIVLGLVCTKTPNLEAAETLKGRIEEAAQFVGLEQLCLSPQCGFASNYIGNPVTIEDERKKLTRIVEVANDVWENA